MSRTYLDWNATAPLRPEARAAMLAAMDEVGNPSSVHAEGRAARAIVEKARAQVAALVGCDPSEVVFTSGATEAAALACSGAGRVHCGDWEHDCLTAWRDATGGDARPDGDYPDGDISARQIANGEVGLVDAFGYVHASQGASIASGEAAVLEDLSQGIARVPYGFGRGGATFAILSAHKFGAPKGNGALIVRSGTALRSPMRGGGQELGRRSGTENVAGIAGTGAAAEAARRDFENGAWEPVARLRDDLEQVLAGAAPDIVIFGRDAPRLPNVSCFAVPGWRGETQVMQLDLAGFAVSAGSACASGKAKPSRVLKAMGHDDVTATSAIRVSMGPTTTEAEVMAFAAQWKEFYQSRKVAAEPVGAMS